MIARKKHVTRTRIVHNHTFPERVLALTSSEINPKQHTQKHKSKKFKIPPQDPETLEPSLIFIFYFYYLFFLKGGTGTGTGTGIGTGTRTVGQRVKGLAIESSQGVKKLPHRTSNIDDIAPHSQSVTAQLGQELSGRLDILSMKSP